MYSESIGFCFCGIVLDPTCPSSVPSASSPELGGLETDHLRRDPLRGGAELGQRVSHVPDPVARSEPRDRGAPELQARAERDQHGLGLTAETGQCAAPTAKLCHRDRLQRGEQASVNAGQLVRPSGRLQAECHRHRLLTVRSRRHR